MPTRNALKRKLSIGLVSVVLLVALAAFGTALATETVTLAYTEPFVGKWESDLSAIPEYVELGITGTIVAEFSADGTLATFYEGEPDDTFGFYIYHDFYVVVDSEGTVESSRFVISQDGTQLDFYDLEGNHMIQYTKVAA